MRSEKTISAIILAAGSSLRFGSENKLEVCLCGKSVLYHAVRAFEQCSYLDEIIIVTKADMVDSITKAYRSNNKIHVIPGGESRNASSLCGLRAAKGDIVLIHDGARPFVDEDIILRCIDGAIETGAVAAAVPATDTIKLCDDQGMVRETTRRSNTWRTQSPQAFNRTALLEAYRNTNTMDPTITDDCMVMEHSGKAVRLVEGSGFNIKITTRADLTMAESIARELGWGGLPRTCCAIGQDSHRTSQVPTEKPMILGGVVFPDYPALEANSDGDVVLHALTNAVSGITAENILGARADVICAGGQKDSRVYLKEALKYLRGRITHLSFTIECKEPHLSSRIAEMRSSIGELVNLPPERVGITATSGEALTDFGRGLGVSVFCIATAEVY
ncbi:MAG: 2-C-methyl-D-erythritol 4-phosphate cytidylyltransferase [Angelakisella sp.]